MSIRHWWSSIHTLLWGSRPSIVPEVLDRSEFRRALVRERNRADRNRSELSLIVLDLASADWGRLEPAEFLFAIQARVRETDLVGWFDRKSIGILLPDTAPNGAFKLAADLRDRLQRAPSGAAWRIYTYPEESLPSTPEGGAAERAGAHKRGAEAQPAAGHAGAESRPAPVQARPVQPGEPSESSDSESEDGFEVTPLHPALLVRRSFLVRLLDIVVSGVALVLLSPLILAAALAVRLSSPGPAFFRQQRMGQGGRTFTFYKLRSMCADAEARKKDVLALNEQEGPVFKATCDPRITPVGRILRKTSIDELPQLWNVLKGDMSLVGPRPPLPDEVAEYEPWQRRRLDLRGGLTCFWQISGRSKIQFDDWVRLDLLYGRRASLWLDLKILALTVPAVLSGRGAR